MSTAKSKNLRNIWYVACHGSLLKKGKTIEKEIDSEKILLGRDEQGKVFALRNQCPHRGIPLTYGNFDGCEIECCYHGWRFKTDGTCSKIPTLPPSSKLDVTKVRAPYYPLREVHGIVLIYLPKDMRKPEDMDESLFPQFPLKEEAYFDFVTAKPMSCSLDHSVIGLIDPAHVPFVHQSWFFRKKTNLKLKTKNFAPSHLGFKMVRHEPSKNSAAYKILKKEQTTEISFQLPGIRIEHIKVGENDIVIMTALTPVNENQTELIQFIYTDIGWFKYLKPIFYRFANTFIQQDVDVFEKLKEGLQNNPPLMLMGDPDMQAKWYNAIRTRYEKCQEEKTPFENPIKPQTLQWQT
ncbi:Rieske 2Fe-2S domain-containing protein [Roseivirga seohaensis]|uniref:Rieske 2Fe-2S domain-containing protein n=1 Tax=Roseivirga seohaensis TaxID=1914963 RepID=UPI003BAD5584